MNKEMIRTQALALKETAEAMIKQGKGDSATEASTRKILGTVVESAKQLMPDNPVLTGITVASSVTWSEVHAIANIVLKSCYES